MSPFEREVEPTHDVFDRFGYDPYSTPLDKLLANQDMGLWMAEAMEGE